MLCSGVAVSALSHVLSCFLLGRSSLTVELGNASLSALEVGNLYCLQLRIVDFLGLETTTSGVFEMQIKVR